MYIKKGKKSLSYVIVFMKGEIYMGNKNFLKITTYAAVFGIIGGMSFEGVTYLSDKLIKNNTAVESVKEDTIGENTSKSSVEAINTSSKTTDSADGVSGVVEDVLPSIVAIDVTAKQTSTDFFGRTYEQDSTGSGSGIIVQKDKDYLYIVTNNHVVSGADSVSVKFNDDKVCSAEVKGTDSAADIAVVAVKLSDISSETMEKTSVAKLGDSDSIKVGEQAIAIGNALGYGTSVTVGYISAKDREVQGEDSNMKLIQTDAAINPGNSGGALVNADGSVIGINSSKYADTSVEGMGFAIPINTAAPIIDSIIKSEAVPEGEAAYLGITTVPSEYAEYYNIPEGIFVKEVTKDAPAEKAGIQQGDIIVKFNGMDVTTMESLQEKLALCRAGDSVKVVVKRADDGEYVEKTVTVTLGKKTENNTEDNSQDNSGSQDNNSQPDGNPSGYGNYFRNFLQ